MFLFALCRREEESPASPTESFTCRHFGGGGDDDDDDADDEYDEYDEYDDEDDVRNGKEDDWRSDFSDEESFRQFIRNQWEEIGESCGEYCDCATCVNRSLHERRVSNVRRCLASDDASEVVYRMEVNVVYRGPAYGQRRQRGVGTVKRVEVLSSRLVN